MKKMLKSMRQKLQEQKGATAVEYALMVSLIAVVIIAAVTTLGTTVEAVFNYISGNIPTS